LKLILHKITTRNISSGGTKYVDICSVDREVQAAEFQVDLQAEI
jgi:hypothetical protein